MTVCTHGSEKPWARCPWVPEKDTTGGPALRLPVCVSLQGQTISSLGGGGKVLAAWRNERAGTGQWDGPQPLPE